MKNVDLGPNDYRKQIKGRWHLPEDPKLARNMFWIAAAILAFIFLNRSGLTSGTLFGVTAIFSFPAGIMFAIWKRDVY